MSNWRGFTLIQIDLMDLLSEIWETSSSISVREVTMGEPHESPIFKIDLWIVIEKYSEIKTKYIESCSCLISVISIKKTPAAPIFIKQLESPNILVGTNEYRLGDIDYIEWLEIGIAAITFEHLTSLFKPFLNNAGSFSIVPCTLIQVAHQQILQLGLQNTPSIHHTWQ